MKKVSKTFALLLLVLGFTAFQAQADQVYDNGPINGTINAYKITPPGTVSDSFTLTGSTSLTLAQIGLHAFPNFTPLTIQWSIGTTAFGNEISSGTSTFSNTFLFVSPLGTDVYKSTFDISGLLGPGTYYLTLENGTGGTLYWDENDGPSVAYQNGLPIGSESFQLFGTNSVPDAGSSVMLLGIGLAGMGWLRRKVR